VQLWNAEQKSNAATSQQQQIQQPSMSSEKGQTTGDIVTSGNSGFPKTSDAPGEQFEPRQTATSEDYEPNPSKSIKLSPQRQALVDDVSFSPCRTSPHMPTYQYFNHTAHLQY
jgi:hypothetical protein